MTNSPLMILGYLLDEFLAKTRQPLPSELHGDYRCSVCKEQYLSSFPDKSPEYPVILPCGHIFGTDCIMRWLSPLSPDGKNSCPTCRRKVFDRWESDWRHQAPPLPPRAEGRRSNPPAEAAETQRAATRDNQNVHGEEEIHVMEFSEDGSSNTISGSSHGRFRGLAEDLDLQPGQIALLERSARGMSRPIGLGNLSLEEVVLVTRRPGHEPRLHRRRRRSRGEGIPQQATAPGPIISEEMRRAEEGWTEFQDRIVGHMEAAHDLTSWDDRFLVGSQVLDWPTLGDFSRGRVHGGVVEEERMREQLPDAFERLVALLDRVPEGEAFRPVDLAVWSSRLGGWSWRINLSLVRLLREEEEEEEEGEASVARGHVDYIEL